MFQLLMLAYPNLGGDLKVLGEHEERDPPRTRRSHRRENVHVIATTMAAHVLATVATCEQRAQQHLRQ